MSQNLLVWQRNTETHHTFTSHAAAVIYPFRHKHEIFFHWEIFMLNQSRPVGWQGNANSVGEAKAAVAQYFLMHSLLSDSRSRPESMPKFTTVELQA